MAEEAGVAVAAPDPESSALLMYQKPWNRASRLRRAVRAPPSRRPARVKAG